MEYPGKSIPFARSHWYTRTTIHFFTANYSFIPADGDLSSPELFWDDGCRINVGGSDPIPAKPTLSKQKNYSNGQNQYWTYKEAGKTEGSLQKSLQFKFMFRALGKWRQNVKSKKFSLPLHLKWTPESHKFQHENDLKHTPTSKLTKGYLGWKGINWWKPRLKLLISTQKC